jgi:hypothetical protein
LVHQRKPLVEVLVDDIREVPRLARILDILSLTDKYGQDRVDALDLPRRGASHRGLLSAAARFL